MSNVTYEYLFGNKPLYPTYEYLFGNKPMYPTYMQLQMVDQSIWFPEGIARDVMVKK
jgi:hypothetical protein